MYCSLVELESIQRPFGLTIERDMYFVQKQISECVKIQIDVGLGRHQHKEASTWE